MRRDHRLPRGERDNRVATHRMDNQRYARWGCAVKERDPSGGEGDAKEDEQRQVRPASHDGLEPLTVSSKAGSGIASSDKRRRSALVRSRSIVSRLGTTTQ